ncbi:MAG: HAD family hydrolase [Pseudomonadota bacterium]
MTAARDIWRGVKLAVFDMDGTLYRQGPMRLRMAAELAGDAALRLSTRRLAVIKAYRRLREEAADDERGDFEAHVVSRVADKCGVSEAEVQTIVDDWIHRRPLKHLRACAVPGLHAAFAALRRSGRTTAVLSDYPVADKLEALGVEPDLAASASSPGVGKMKPNPAGLERLMASVGVAPDETLMIGDRLDRDVAAAERAGARWLLRASQGEPADRRFRDFRSAPFDAIPALADA